MGKTYNLGIPDAGLRVVKFEQGDIEFEDKQVFEEMSKNTVDVLNEYYNKYKEEKITGENNTQNLILDAQQIIMNFKNALKQSEDLVFNFSQSSKEIDEVINTNIKKGESDTMAIKKELDNKEVAEEEVKDVVQANFEDGCAPVPTEPEVKAEEAPVAPEAEKVEEEAKKEDFEAECKECLKNEENNEEDDKEDDKMEDAKECEEKECEAKECEEKKCEEKVEEALDMSKAERKTFEARIATLENNLKAVRAELKVAAPFKALYEEAVAKIAELEAYKEDVELDRLKADKEKYASTCNFNALEDEDKTVVQEKIDDYKFSLYDFKAFMADVLKKYSRKQVYSNMEKIISYFSMEDEGKKADEIELPSDKNQAERILDKYSDIKI